MLRLLKTLFTGFLRERNGKRWQDAGENGFIHGELNGLRNMGNLLLEVRFIILNTIRISKKLAKVKLKFTRDLQKNDCLQSTWAKKIIILGLCFLYFSPCPSVSAALIFNLIDIGGVGPGSQAETGFLEAASLWQNEFEDDVTINLRVGFSSLDGNVLGQTSSNEGTLSYSDVASFLNSDQTSADDAIAVANLPSSSSLDLWINRTNSPDNPNGSGSPIPYLDNNNSGNNTTLNITSANAKALGALAGDSPLPDGTITFNSDFSFDFDQSDGISSGLFDFVGIAAHEIGHAMGFISGVDVLDNNSPPVGGPFAEDTFDFVSTLDLFRFSNDSVAQNSLDWTADTRDKYFSIDGGVTNLGGFSTGSEFGDGNQASHFKDFAIPLGLMDPTVAPGNLLQITSLDIQAFDVIGWDPVAVSVPEPSTYIMFLTLVFLFRSRFSMGKLPR